MVYWSVVDQNEGQSSRERQLIRATQILPLIKQAGYKSPEEVVEIIEQKHQELLTQLSKEKFISLGEWAKANGYVKLAEDQSFPTNDWGDTELNRGWKIAQKNMLETNWRKVILPKE